MASNKTTRIIKIYDDHGIMRVQKQGSDLVNLEDRVSIRVLCTPVCKHPWIPNGLVNFRSPADFKHGVNEHFIFYITALLLMYKFCILYWCQRKMQKFYKFCVSINAKCRNYVFFSRFCINITNINAKCRNVDRRNKERLCIRRHVVFVTLSICLPARSYVQHKI